jgi:nitroimidazol reductase NimA-like FMN-containing flavoprotein (pyridoxamine 5'-phosphate oxidase superfamily)
MTATSPEQLLVERFSEPGVSPTPWSDVEAVLESAELFWLSTVRSDGRPHVAPLPAVWHEGSLHLCTGADEQKAVNIERNPRVALTTGNNRWKEGLDVVVEGNAERIGDDRRLRVLADLWRSKYSGDWDYKVANGVLLHDEGAEAVVFEVAPVKVLSFAKGPFAQTRYTF